MAHCSLCTRAGRIVVYDGHLRACRHCALAVANLVVAAPDATVRTLWVLPADPPRGPAPAAEPFEPERELGDVERGLESLRASVAETVPEDDAETHAQLAIAYREMGLYDDAVAELEIAQKAAGEVLEAELAVLHAISLDDAGRAFEALRTIAVWIAAGNCREGAVALLFRRLPRASVDELRGVLFRD